jgi:PAS domain S-box-containing protein
MKRDKKGLSIFLRLLLSLLGVVIVISSALTMVFYVYNKRSLEKHTKENILQQFESIDYHLHIKMHGELLNEIRLLSSNPSLDAFMMSSELEKDVNARAVERLFLESLKYIHSYDSIYFVDALGRESVKVDWTGRVRQFRDISRSALFLNIKSGQAGSIHFENPRRNAGGRVTFSIGINKLDPDIGQFGGAVVIDYNFDDFLEHVSKIRIFDENPIWVFDPNGQVLKQPDQERVRFDPRAYFISDTQTEPRLILREEGMLVYQDFLFLPGKPLFRLAISIPSSLVLGDIRSVLRFFILVFVVSLLVISAIAYYLAGYLSQPITELAHAASRLAKRDLSTKVSVKATGEVQMLVDSFNLMAENLEKTTVSKDYVDGIIGSMVDSLIVVSPDRSITQVNVAGCRLLEYEEKDLVNKPIDTIIEHDPREYPSVIEEVLSKGFIGNSERVYRAKSGKRIPVLFSASALRNTRAETELQRIICVAQDITERKQDEEMLKAYSQELKEINEELKSFAYIVSHDLRAPLVNIRGFSDELIHGIKELGPLLERYLSGFPEAEQQKFSAILQKDIPEALKFIGSSVNRMDNLINAVLKLSRAGRRNLNPETIMARDLVQSIVHSLAHQIEVRNIAVTIHDLPTVVTDKTALEQIFGNLLDNAIKYLEPGRTGEIGVSAEHSDGEVVFHVRDNGRGMAKEDIPRAFEIFRRLGKQDVPGEGMGLAYVKTLIRSLGGRIWCESELGAGTAFSFTIPDVEKLNDANTGATV